MIFPGSRLWHEGEAADLSVLTDEIKAAAFSGHILLEFQDSLDLVIVSRGEFLKVVERIGRRIMTTKKYREIWGKCQIKKGRMYVFELPPPLAARLRGLTDRSLLCSGTADSCDLPRAILDMKTAKHTGFIDCTGAEGRGLLEFRNGVISSCYFSEFHGLAWVGFDAFRRWYTTLQQTLRPFSLHISTFQESADHSDAWDTLLTENLEEVRLPLRASGERLFSAFGRTAFPGEILFMENMPGEDVVYVLDGRVELSRMAGGVKQVIGYVGPGTFLNLPVMSGVKTSSLTAIASANCRYLSFGGNHLATVFLNSPSLGANFISSILGQLGQVTRRLEVYRNEPSLMDLEYRALEVLNRIPDRIGEGLEPGKLLSELSRTSSVPLTEIDRMISKLVEAERLVHTGGRIYLHPEEL